MALAHAAMSDAALTARFREVELAERRLVAERALLVAEAQRRDVHLADRHHSLAGWLRAHANWSPAEVSRTRRLANLVHELPQVADALLDGRLGSAQVDELARAFSNPRCGRQLGDTVGVLVDLGQRLPFPDFRTCVRRWETLADLDGAHRERGHGVEHRTASVLGDRDGLVVSATGGTALEAAELTVIFDAFVRAELEQDLGELRDRHLDDGNPAALPRSDGQRRFDALVSIFRTANASDGGPLAAPATVDVLVDSRTFERAHADHGLHWGPEDLTRATPAGARCETTTGIPLLPDDIVHATLTGWVRRVVTDGAGVVTDLGRRRRAFTGPAREAVQLLARRCQYPGCAVPSAAAQVDHVAEWGRHRGHTSTANAAVLCGRHNRWKHFCLQARRDRCGQLHFQRPDGSWLTPVGRPPPDEADLLPLGA
jgi:hypothetical protein